MADSQVVLREIEPVIKDLAKGINGIVGQLKQLQSPLLEATSKVPEATEELDKISKQTEQATHRMLDQIEKITRREQEVIEGLKTIAENVNAGNLAGITGLVDTLASKADDSCNDAFDIMNALQFQDITSQQIEHAASLLEDVEIKLIQIIKILPGGSDHGSLDEIVRARKERAFDPHADMANRITEQEEVDTLVAQKDLQ